MKGRTEKIYHTLPVFLQNIAISFFGYYWYKRRFGGVFASEYNEVVKRDKSQNFDWVTWQENELKKLLVHSFNNVPYYKKVLAENNWTLEKISNFKMNQLTELPILEKQDFRKYNITELLANEFEPDGTYIYTSGSTGTPLKIRYSARMHQRYLAIYELYVRNWAGLTNKNRRGVIGGRRILKDGNSKGPYYRYNFIEKQAYFSAYHISKETAANYLEGIVKYKLDYLEGYSSAIYFLARFIEENGLKAPKLKAVLGSTDKLTKEMRDGIRRVFQCEVFDSYNGVDLCNLISECEHHNYHIVSEVGIVEIMNENGQPCKPGEIGEIISTGLLNYDQPLIRYKIGDLVKLSENQKCSCGRSLPVVDEIIGRIEDVVIGKDGREMRRFNRILIDIQCVVEGQIIQHTIEKFEIKLVVTSSPTKTDLEAIQSRMRAQLGEIDLEINVVNSIPRGPNGKFKSVISHVKKNS
jgi:phenylacetate-CoA ligase